MSLWRRLADCLLRKNAPIEAADPIVNEETLNTTNEPIEEDTSAPIASENTSSKKSDTHESDSSDTATEPFYEEVEVEEEMQVQVRRADHELQITVQPTGSAAIVTDVNEQTIVECFEVDNNIAETAKLAASAAVCASAAVVGAITIFPVPSSAAITVAAAAAAANYASPFAVNLAVERVRCLYNDFTQALADPSSGMAVAGAAAVVAGSASLLTAYAAPVIFGAVATVGIAATAAAQVVNRVPIRKTILVRRVERRVIDMPPPTQLRAIANNQPMRAIAAPQPERKRSRTPRKDGESSAKRRRGPKD
jgi:hypothetical protein